MPSRRTRSKIPKGYSQKEKEVLCEEILELFRVRFCLAKISKPKAEDLLSYVAFVLCDWFSDKNWRPYDSDKGKTLKRWLILIVEYSVKDYIRRESRSRTPDNPKIIIINWLDGTGVEEEDLTQVPYVEDEHISRVESKQEVQDIMSLCNTKQREVLKLILQGHSVSKAGVLLGRGANYSYYILTTIRNITRSLHGQAI